MKLTIPILAAVAILSGIVSASEHLQGASSNNPGVPWPAADALGRVLPVDVEVRSPRPDRQVGIFYFLNHNYRPNIYDIAQILAKEPDAPNKPQSPLWGPFHAPHYWGQPLFGYYHNTDPWVLRRHGQILADAGVDTLIFDTTNGATLKGEYMAICEVFDAMRKQGERTPQICFMVNTKAGECAQKLYEDLYKPGLYPGLWYRWEGKPLLICDPKEASPEVRKFFTLRRAHWPFTTANTPYAWHWEDAYPQPYGYTTNRKVAEMVNVSVAQNLRVKDGKVTNMSNGDARGRSFHNGRMDSTPGSIERGLNFEEQWKRALTLDPPFVMVTGWNEWNTSRFDDPTNGKSKTRVVFMDQFGPHYSRDIEPMTGGFGDNYYYQMVANIRRYKGVPPSPVGSPAKSISIAGSFEQWRDVGPEFKGHVGDIDPRNHTDVVKRPLVNRSGRNDLELMKVTCDETNLYFYLRTRAPITPATDAAGLWLLLDTDMDHRTGWNGYNFIINRETGWIEKNAGGWKWEKIGKSEVRIARNELQMAVARAALGLKQPTFDFKWADNQSQPCDVMDFYSNGDVAPAGRFNFRYIPPSVTRP